MTAISVFARRLLKVSLVLLLVLVLGVTLLIWSGLRIDLSMLRNPVQFAARQALGREVTFGGPVWLVPSLSPHIEVSDVTIANPPGFGSGSFASAGLLQMQIELLPLLSAEVYIDEIAAETVRLDLQSNAAGEPNWSFEDRSTAKERSGDATSLTRPDSSVLFASIESLSLTDIQVTYLDQAVGRSLSFEVQELQGSMPEGEALVFDVRGKINDYPYDLDVTAGRLFGQAASRPLRIEGEIAGTSIVSEGELVDGETLEITESLTLGEVDVGGLLQRAGLINGLEARVGSLRAETHLRGDSLSEIFADSHLSLRVEKGNWLLRDKNSNGELDVAVSVGELVIVPGEPLSIKLDARAGALPVTIDVVGARLADYLKLDTELPLRLGVEGAGAELVLETRAKRPIDIDALVFHLSLKGKSIASLSTIFGRDLPPFGPYLLAGSFATAPNGYSVRDLELRVGETNLKGKFSLDTVRKPPFLEVDLRSDRLQVNDFDLQEWSPAEDKPKSGRPSRTDSSSQPAKTLAVTAEHYALLADESLRAQDMTASLVVNEVLSGRDRLGHGSLRLVLKNGHLRIDPLKLAIPGGEAQVRFSYLSTGEVAELALAADVEQLDYGILARRIDTASKVDGRLSLDIDISARGKSIDDLLANGNGRLDFGVWPGELEADVFDLWAVNVVDALTRKVDDGSGSRVNCVIARFTLENGVMNDHVIFADTTRMRVEGTARVDFNQQTLKVRAKPKAKRPEFFSLATPVGLSGSFTDYDIRVNPVELGGSAVSFLTSPLHVPLRRLFKRGEDPAQDEELCMQTWKASDVLTTRDAAKDKQDP